MAGQDDYMNDADKIQQKEHEEKILVPVRRRKYTDEEELSAKNDKPIPFEAPRRWRAY